MEKIDRYYILSIKYPKCFFLSFFIVLTNFGITFFTMYTCTLSIDNDERLFLQKLLISSTARGLDDKNKGCFYWMNWVGEMKHLLYKHRINIRESQDW